LQHAVGTRVEHDPVTDRNASDGFRGLDRNPEFARFAEEKDADAMVRRHPGHLDRSRPMVCDLLLKEGLPSGSEELVVVHLH
jgi:hypothetical protein